MRREFWMFCLVLLSFLQTAVAPAVELVVTNTIDFEAPVGSLRRAIQRTQPPPLGDLPSGPHSIVFDIPASDPGAVTGSGGEVLYWRIQLTRMLDVSGVTIDARSLGTNSLGQPRIVIDGSGISDLEMIRVRSKDTALFGMTFQNAPSNAVEILDPGFSHDFAIQGCRFESNTDNAIYIQNAGQILIGGPDAGEGNVFLDNRVGVFTEGGMVFQPDRDSTVHLFGNRFGIDGETVSGHRDYAVLLQGHTEGTVIGNVFHGARCLALFSLRALVVVRGNSFTCSDFGIQLFDSEGTQVFSNTITSELARDDAENQARGMLIQDSRLFEIGDNDEPDSGANAIGSALVGIQIERSTGEVAGNLIGVERDGVSASGNGTGLSVTGADDNLIIQLNTVADNRTGILIEDSERVTVRDNRLGTDRSGVVGMANGTGLSLVDTRVLDIRRNVISGNSQNGISMRNGFENTIENNFIGLGFDGFTRLGNGGHGIKLGIDTAQSHILRNLIVFNGDTGVFLDELAATHNNISENQFFQNARLAIDLEGISANDPGDLDDGPNTGLNFPDILSAEYFAAQGELVVTHTVDVSGLSFEETLVEFYLSDGAGEGAEHLGTQLYPANGSLAFFTFDISAADAAGRSVVALSRVGKNGRYNTSEFSPAVAITGIEQEGPFFVRGDSNGDGSLNIGDPSYTANFIFGLSLAFPMRCLAAANANGDGSVNIADVSFTANFVFGVGVAAPPPAPFPECGAVVKAEDVALGCDVSAESCR